MIWRHIVKSEVFLHLGLVCLKRKSLTAKLGILALTSQFQTLHGDSCNV